MPLNINVCTVRHHEVRITVAREIDLCQMSNVFIPLCHEPGTNIYIMAYQPAFIGCLLTSFHISRGSDILYHISWHLGQNDNMRTCKYIPFIQLVMNALLVSMDKHHCNRYPDTASFSLCQVEGDVCLCLELMFVVCTKQQIFLKTTTAAIDPNDVSPSIC